MTLSFVSSSTPHGPVSSSNFDHEQYYKFFTGQGYFQKCIPTVSRQLSALSSFHHPPSVQHECRCTCLSNASFTSSTTAQYTVPVQYVLFYAFLVPLQHGGAHVMYVNHMHQHRTSVTFSCLPSRAAPTPPRLNIAHRSSSN